MSECLTTGPRSNWRFQNWPFGSFGVQVLTWDPFFLAICSIPPSVFTSLHTPWLLAQQISLRSESSDANASCSVCSWPASPLRWNANVGLPGPGFSLPHPKGGESCRIQISIFSIVQWSPTQATYATCDCGLLRLTAAKKLDLSRKVISLLTQEIQDIPGAPGDFHPCQCQWHRFPRCLNPSQSVSVHHSHHSHHSSSLGFLSWSSFVRTSNRGNSSETNENLRETRQEIKRSQTIKDDQRWSKMIKEANGNL